MRTVRLSLMFWALSALAQFPFPGQGPGYPGGGYPGGRRVPPQQQPQPQQQQQQPQNSRGRSRPSTIDTEGMLRRVAGNQLVIEADDHRIVWYRVTAQTTSRKDDKSVDVAAFQPGDRLSVESSEDQEGNYTAVAVEWERAGTLDERTAARETWDLPSASASANAGPARRNTVGDRDDDDRPILRRKPDDSAPAPAPPSPPPAPAPGPAPATQASTQASPAQTSNDDDAGTGTKATQMRPADAPADADDPGRPVLRRGGAAAQRQPVTNPGPAAPPAASATSSAANGTPNSSSSANAGNPTMVGRSSSDAPVARPSVSQPILPQEDPLMGKVRNAAYTFSSSLPNFFCQQITTRYATQSVKDGWQTLDIVTADVQYLDGQESYKNIKAGGKAVRSMDDLEGTKSTGEFSSILQDLMSGATGAAFRRSGTDSIHGRSAIVFKLEVPRERSHWRIEAPSQLYYPAYRGSIWVDRDTSRVLRIEMEAHNLPALFPFDTVEEAVDYDFIRLASAEEEFLLPADAEALNCERGSSACSRNRIEFHNYKKFDAATSISFDTK